MLFDTVAPSPAVGRADGGTAARACGSASELLGVSFAADCFACIPSPSRLSIRNDSASVSGAAGAAGERIGMAGGGGTGPESGCCWTGSTS